MKKYGVIAAFLMAALLVISANTAQAYTYATSGAWQAAGGVTVGYFWNGELSNALGAPDTNDVNIQDGNLGNDSFLSLGRGGAAVFDFGVDFSGVASIYETTLNRGLNLGEKAEVYAAESSFDFTSFAISFAADTSGGDAVRSLLSGTGFEKVADLTNNEHESTITLTGTYRYMLILDTTGSTGGDGFDIDAIGVTAAPVPEPATVLLLGCGLIGLAGLGRKRLSRK